MTHLSPTNPSAAALGLLFSYCFFFLLPLSAGACWNYASAGNASAAVCHSHTEGRELCTIGVHGRRRLPQSLVSASTAWSDNLPLFARIDVKGLVSSLTSGSCGWPGPPPRCSLSVPIGCRSVTAPLWCMPWARPSELGVWGRALKPPSPRSLAGTWLPEYDGGRHMLSRCCMFGRTRMPLGERPVESGADSTDLGPGRAPGIE